MSAEGPEAPAAGSNGRASAPPVWSSNRATGSQGDRGAGRVDDEAVIGLSPFVSVPTLVAALRRSSRLVVVLAAVGLLGGLAVAIALPPPYTATSTLLLQHSSGSDPQRDMVTDRQVLLTRVVAQGAVERGHLPIDAKDLLAQYDGTVQSERVLTIIAHGASGAEAVARAQAVSDSFLAFRQSQLRLQLQATVKAIQDRENPLISELSALDGQVNDYSAAPQKSPAAIRAFGDILTHRAQVGSQIARLQGQIDSDNADVDNVIAGSRVIDPATMDNRSAKKRIATYALLGLLFGLVLGVGGIPLREVLSEAARKRTDVANALGAPVAVSVAPVRKPLLAKGRGRDLTAAAKVPGITPVVRHLRRVLDSTESSPPALLVVALNDEWPAALAVAALATELRRPAATVRIIDYSHRGILQPAAVPGAVRVVSLDSASTARSDERLGRTGGGEADPVLVLATLDPEVGAFHLRTWATTAVAIVTAGRVSPTALHSAHRMLRLAGIELVSAVLIGADRSDETFGISAGGRMWPGAAASPVNGASSPTGAPAAATPGSGP